MRITLALIGIVFILSDAVRAEQTTGNLKGVQGTTIAQSYCAICGNERTSCVTRCNGSGACIQNCDDDYRLCVERACRR
jgi:hypothetical protein